MGRPRSANPRAVIVPVRLTLGETQAMDEARKGLSRAAYIRLAVQVMNLRRGAEEAGVTQSPSPVSQVLPPPSGYAPGS